MQVRSPLIACKSTRPRRSAGASSEPKSNEAARMSGVGAASGGNDDATLGGGDETGLALTVDHLLTVQILLRNKLPLGCESGEGWGVA